MYLRETEADFLLEFMLFEAFTLLYEPHMSVLFWKVC